MVYVIPICQFPWPRAFRLWSKHKINMEVVQNWWGFAQENLTWESGGLVPPPLNRNCHLISLGSHWTEPINQQGHQTFSFVWWPAGVALTTRGRQRSRSLKTQLQPDWASRKLKWSATRRSCNWPWGVTQLWRVGEVEPDVDPFSRQRAGR